MRKLPTWVFLVGLVGLMFATVICAVIGYSAAYEFGSYFQPDQATAVSVESLIGARPTQTLTLTPTRTQTPPPGVTFTPIPPTPTTDPVAQGPTAIPTWDDPRTITILLMGIDERRGFDNDRAYRSDTMILLNINPITKKVGMLSLPRDLWVSIPGYQPERINNANYLGDLNNYPGGGGPALAADTIEQNFGIRVDKYVRINFDVFFALVDTLAPDGVEICITEAIDDPSYPDAGYGTIRVTFEPGCQRLNSERLLQYARTRKTQGGDFDRARRQQQVLRAAQQEFLSVGGVTRFAAQIPTLWDQLSDSVVTNLTVNDVLQLGLLATEISPDDINTAVIDTRHVTFAKSERGEDILIPNYAAIYDLIQETFNPRPSATIAELRESSLGEGAQIYVYNNTNVAGLAGKTQEWLLGRQVTITGTGNIPEPTNTLTTIRVYGSYNYTARYLARLLGIPDERIEPGRDGLIQSGVMVVVGEDLQGLLTGGTPQP